MDLNYKMLMSRAADKAEEVAALMFPPGEQRDEAKRSLTARYYSQYITPPPAPPTAR